MNRGFFSPVTTLKWCATLVLVVFLLASYAQNQVSEPVAGKNDELMVENIRKLYDSINNVPDFATKKRLGDSVFALTKQQNEAAHIQSLLFQVMNLSNHHTQYFNEAYRLAEKNRRIDDMCQVEYCRGQYYIARRQFDTAMIHILNYRDMTPLHHGEGYNNILNLLGDIYYQAGLFGHAREVYSSILDEYYNSENFNFYRPYVLMNNLGQMALKSGNISEAQTWFNRSLTMAEQYLYTEYRNNTIAYIKIKLAETYLLAGNLLKADSLIADINTYNTSDVFADVWHEFTFVNAQRLIKKELYEEAAVQLKSLLPTDTMCICQFRFIPETYRLLSHVYYHIDSCDLALDFAVKYNNTSDSIRISEHVAQSMIILADRNHKLTQLELATTKKRVYMLVSGIAVLFIFILLGGRLYYALYKSKIDLVKKTLELENQAQWMIKPDNSDEVISEINEVEHNDNEEENEEDLQLQEELIARLKTYMETEKPYLDPKLSIRDVATHLSTNRTYLSRAINSHHYTTFPNYLNVYRIRESIRLITSGFTLTHTQEALAKECGFANRTSFGIVFKKLVGVTPSFFAAHYNKQELKL